MPLTNAETHYFDALIAEDIALYKARATSAQEDADRADVVGSPYHLSRLADASWNRGIQSGLRLARELLDKAQT